MRYGDEVGPSISPAIASSRRPTAAMITERTSGPRMPLAMTLVLILSAKRSTIDDISRASLTSRSVGVSLNLCGAAGAVMGSETI